MDPPGRETTVWNTARAGDPERYLSALFAPATVRPDLMALTAFNVELAAIAGSVSEPMLGEIRLQWWRDSLAEHQGGRLTGHPVADALGGSIRRHELPVPLLMGMVDARSFDLTAEALPDWQATRSYLRKTSGTMFSMAARILGGPGRDFDRAGAAAGDCHGLAELLRLFPLHAARRQLFLPARDFRERGLDLDDIFDCRRDDALVEALRSIRERVRQDLGCARSRIAGLPRECIPAFLPLALVQPLLRVLSRNELTPFNGPVGISPLAHLSILSWAAIRRRI